MSNNSCRGSVEGGWYTLQGHLQQLFSSSSINGILTIFVAMKYFVGHNSLTHSPMHVLDNLVSYNLISYINIDKDTLYSHSAIAMSYKLPFKHAYISCTSLFKLYILCWSVVFNCHFMYWCKIFHAYYWLFLSFYVDILS